MEDQKLLERGSAAWLQSSGGRGERVTGGERERGEEDEREEGKKSDLTKLPLTKRIFNLF